MRKQKLKQALATVMIALGCLFFTLSIFTIWLDRVITDTDTYVSTVAPLASDPAIQNAVADRVGSELFARTDVEQLAREALPPRAEFLAPAISDGLKNVVEGQVRTVIASGRFQKIWGEANRASHSFVLGVLLGDNSVVSADQGKISVNLGAALEEVRQRLDESGITFLDPALSQLSQQNGVELTLFQSGNIATVQRGLSLLERMAWVLPLITIVLLAGAVWMMPRNLRTVQRIGLGLAAAAVLMLVAVATARGYYLGSLSGSDVSTDAAAAVFDIVTGSLKAAFRSAFVFGLLVSGGATLAGPSAFAVRLRQTTVAAVREAWSRAGTPGPLTEWISAHIAGLRIGGIVAGLLFLVLRDQPTALYLVLTALAFLIYLGAIEFLGGAIRNRQI